MEIKTQKTLVKAIGSKWLFIWTLLLFTIETSWLALTSRFPMAFDEIYHFGLIQFFSHRLNPVVTSQASDTYRFGAIVQNPSFLYHYLLSFPDRFIMLFTKSPEAQVIGLRFINIGIALCSLLVMRKLLRLLRIPDGLANVVVLAFALTPIVTVLSAQINYDNLLILAVVLCVYETVLFTRKLDQKVFAAKEFLTLICLCLFAALVKFSFLPILLALIIVVAWRIAASRRRYGTGPLVSSAKKSFARISLAYRLLLLTAGILGGSLFIRFYAVNIVKYHNPVPQCNQVLSIQDCKQYYAWDSNYIIRQDYIAHPTTNKMGVLHYAAFWLRFSGADLYGAILPLQGPYYLSPSYYSIVIILAAATLVCTAIFFRKMLRGNKDLSTLVLVSFIYILFLWGRNYHDYLQLGQPVAINGRYLVPVLIYFYTLLGLGVHYALAGRGKVAPWVKLTLALVVIFSFAYYGGYTQYVSQIDPVYGRLGPSNEFVLPNYQTGINQ